MFYVPETKKASELLMDMQKRQEHMAVVVDEYGGAVGIVTIEDIGEEIVGSIDNEYDSGEKLYKKLAAGRYLINGRMDMDALSQLLATKFPEGNYETLGGFLMHRLGKIPQRRERLDYRGITFIIENADQKSIKEVMVIFPAQLKANRGLFEKRPSAALRCKPHRSTYVIIRLAIRFLRALHLSIFEQPQVGVCFLSFP